MDTYLKQNSEEGEIILSVDIFMNHISKFNEIPYTHNRNVDKNVKVRKVGSP